MDNVVPFVPDGASLAGKTVTITGGEKDLWYETARLIITVGDEAMGKAPSLLFKPTLRSTPIPPTKLVQIPSVFS
ncbi:hypothetical protein N7471_005504 [Penicillium samsonianum]|uniref:uncharacterized protein n=1 Tax=Penicillium samsonianum TaxID=1882272 RepID=UPI00254938B2|nr:uncharacterized protein N7471_005504 [Penicillium samsonianum]KAJ6139018.1 hypothetical protein N7471_005504 [Penicillium samsonianum]